MQENTSDDDYNSLSYTFYSYSILEVIDNQNELVKITIEINSKVQVLFYNVEILKSLNFKNVKKINFKYFSRNYLVLFNE